MGVTGTLAVLVDVPLLLFSHASASTALATGIFASGLAAGLAAPLALLLAALAAVVRWIWLRFGRRWAALAPVVLVSLPIGWGLAMPPDTKHFYARLAMIVAFTLVRMPSSPLVAAGGSRCAGWARWCWGESRWPSTWRCPSASTARFTISPVSSPSWPAWWRCGRYSVALPKFPPSVW